MTFYIEDTVRERARHALAAADRPLTVAQLADQLDTSTHQTGRALRQLETMGAAVREHGRPWAKPDQWRAR
jgi:predicted ArsR family transcriptional regulator